MGTLSLSATKYYRISVSAFFFIQGLVFSSWASRIPDIKDALHLNEAVLGSVLFALPVGQLSAMALSGYLVSRYGSKLVLTVAALLYPAALVGLGAASSIGQLTLGLFLFGITANLCNIAVNTQGVGVERLYNRSIMASFHGLWSLAGFCGGLVSTLMVGYDIPPLMHFCIIYAVTFAVLVTMRGSMLPRDAKPVDEKKTKKVFVRPDRYILLLGLIAFGSMACEGTMFDWSGVYFETVIRPPKDVHDGLRPVHRRPARNAVRGDPGDPRQRHRHRDRVAAVGAVPAPDYRHAGIFAGRIRDVVGRAVVLQLGRAVENDAAGGGAGDRLDDRIFRVSARPAGNRLHRPRVESALVVRADRPDWPHDDRRRPDAATEIVPGFRSAGTGGRNPLPRSIAYDFFRYI